MVGWHKRNLLNSSLKGIASGKQSQKKCRNGVRDPHFDASKCACEIPAPSSGPGRHLILQSKFNIYDEIKLTKRWPQSGPVAFGSGGVTVLVSIMDPGLKTVPFWEDLCAVTSAVPPWGLFKVLAEHPDIMVNLQVLLHKQAFPVGWMGRVRLSHMYAAVF